MSGDEVIIEDNVITGNNNAGIIVTSQDFVTEIASDTGSDPNPDAVQIRDNVMFNNGASPEGEMKLLMLTSSRLPGQTSSPIRVRRRRSAVAVSQDAAPTEHTVWMTGRIVTARLSARMTRLPGANP